MTNLDVVQKLKLLSQAFLKSLPQKISDLNQKWLDVKKDYSMKSVQELYILAHSLFGTAGTFGAKHVSQVAGKIEQAVLDYQNTGDEISFTDIENHIYELQALMKDSANINLFEFQELDFSSNKAKMIYILDVDVPKVQDKLIKTQYQFNCFSKPYELIECLKSSKPDMLIIDIEFAKSIQMEELKKLQDEVIFIYVADKDNIESRLFSIRHGGQGFLVKPYSFNQLLRLLDDLFDARQIHNERVLIVDDARDLAEYHAELVRHAGMQAEVVTSPEHFLTALKDFQPDIIIMDIIMPYCNGIELAKLVQQYQTYTIPIIFLSTISERKRQLEVLSLAGDEFLTKPVEPKHLIASIRNRMMKTKVIRSRMTRDSLTNLYNHTMIYELLERELTTSAKTHGYFTIAMLDLDHFKMINDHYGHQAGDLVIKNLSMFLQSQIRATDIVGRYGGEEFLLILKNTSLEMGQEIVNKLIHQFSQVPHHLGGETVYVQMSAGLAASIKHDHAKSLIRAADEALYQAKEQGRNRAAVNDE